MGLWRLGFLCLPVALAGCGGGDKPAVTLTVTCAGNEALVGARSIDVLGDVVNGRVIDISKDEARVELGEGIQARCPIAPNSATWL